MKYPFRAIGAWECYRGYSPEIDEFNRGGKSFKTHSIARFFDVILIIMITKPVFER